MTGDPPNCTRRRFQRPTRPAGRHGRDLRATTAECWCRPPADAPAGIHARFAPADGVPTPCGSALLLHWSRPDIITTVPSASSLVRFCESLENKGGQDARAERPV